MLKAKNSITVLASKCVICGCKRSRSIIEQETNGLLSSLKHLNFCDDSFKSILITDWHNDLIVVMAILPC